MPNLTFSIKLPRCPHCNVADPLLQNRHYLETTDGNNQGKRHWRFYMCSRCGGIVTAWAHASGDPIQQLYPSTTTVDEAIPPRARAYLDQAIQSMHAPSGSLMLTGSAVDAMLKNRGYKDGSLYARINKAAEEHLLTKEMAEWAHEIRLDANDQRHSDETAPLPSDSDARRCIEFAKALGQILFILPAQVKRGIESTKEPKKTGPTRDGPSPLSHTTARQGTGLSSIQTP
jgi:hypothetical protein